MMPFTGKTVPHTGAVFLCSCFFLTRCPTLPESKILFLPPEISFSAFTGKVMGKRITIIPCGIALPGKEISIVEKEIFFSASPGKMMGKEIIAISFGITFRGKEITPVGKEIAFLSCPGRLPDKG